MDTDKLFHQLVKNALDFLARSIDELEESPKYSVINFHAAVELFLKARLLSDHWTLVVTNRQEPDWGKFIAGDFQSVTLKEAAKKLDKAVRSGLTKKEFDAFDKVTIHRNKMVHFFHDAHSEDKDGQQQQTIAIAKQQLTAWYFLHRLLRNNWKDIFDPWSHEIERIDSKLRKHHDYLQTIFDNINEKIKEREKSGFVFLSCPSCAFKSKEHSSEFEEIYKSECLVCELTENCLTIKCPKCDESVYFSSEGFSTCNECGEKFEPDDVADILLDESEYHYAIKNGDNSWDLGNCSNCDGYHTVVRIRDDYYACASCFETFNSMQYCQWCNDPNTGDMEHSFSTGCSQCDGRGGWDELSHDE